MIKVGQIYKDLTGKVFAIVEIFYMCEEYGKAHKIVRVAFPDGRDTCFPAESIPYNVLKNGLVAEYSSWNEIKNSKEFKL